MDNPRRTHVRPGRAQQLQVPFCPPSLLDGAPGAGSCRIRPGGVGCLIGQRAACQSEKSKVATTESPQRHPQKPSTTHSSTANASDSVRFYDFAGFRIDVRRRCLLQNGELIAIKPKALDTLLALVVRWLWKGFPL